MTGSYRIVFRGVIAAGFSIDSVKASFVRQFNVNPSHIDRLFSGTPMTLKRNLDLSQAEKIQQAILTVGGVTEIAAEEDGPPPPKRWTKTGQTPEAATTDDAHLQQNRDSAPPAIEQTKPGHQAPWSNCDSIPLAELESPEYSRQQEATSLPNVFDDAAYYRKKSASQKKVEKFQPGVSRTPFIGCLALLLVVTAFLVFRGYQSRGIQHGPGVLAPSDPIQTSARKGTSFEHNGFTITPKAEFQVNARVLSVKHYSSGRESDLSPTDLALGWGRMSDESILSEIKVTQSARFYHWHVQKFPIPRKEIESHSANMHMVPATQDIKKLLKTVKKGHLVTFSGKLIYITADGGWYWKSSLIRTDTGMGACEIVWLEDFQVQ